MVVLMSSIKLSCNTVSLFFWTTYSFPAHSGNRHTHCCKSPRLCKLNKRAHRCAHKQPCAWGGARGKVPSPCLGDRGTGDNGSTREGEGNTASQGGLEGVVVEGGGGGAGPFFCGAIKMLICPIPLLIGTMENRLEFLAPHVYPQFTSWPFL